MQMPLQKLSPRLVPQPLSICAPRGRWTRAAAPRHPETVASMETAAPFAPRCAVVLRELEPEARRRYVTMLANRNVESRQDGDAWVANLRILAPGVDAPALAEKPAAKPKPPLRDRLARAIKSDEGPPDVASINTLAYPRFASLVWRAVGTSPTAEVKPLPWLMRCAESIYDARYKRDAAALQKNVDVDRFPEFVIACLMRESGVDGIVEKKCWALLCSAEHHRIHNKEAEVFGRFLAETWDADALLFYLRCRHEVMRATKTTLGARWAPGEAARQDVVALSPCDVQRVARNVWREHSEELVDAVEAFRESHGRLEAAQFLDIAVGQYVRARDDVSPDVADLVEAEADALVSDVALSEEVVGEIRGEVVDFLRTATVGDDEATRLAEVRGEAAALVDALAAYAAEHAGLAGE